MNFKRIGIFLMLLFFAKSAFSYDYVKKIYDSNRYAVRATGGDVQNTTYHVVQIIDLYNHISRCYVLKNEKSTMNAYQILGCMSTATLEDTVRTTKWDFWFQTDDGWIVYKYDGSYF